MSDILIPLEELSVMANVLKREKQEAIIKCLVDGNSIRSTERITGVHRTLKQTPAIGAGVMFQPWTVGDLLDAALSEVAMA